MAMYAAEVGHAKSCLIVLFVFWASAGQYVALPTANGGSAATVQVRSNILLVIADDLDARLGSVELALNATLAYFRKRGTIFENAFVTTPVCCPSRSSILSGLYVHNHGALTNNDDCNGDFWKANIEHKTIGVRMQKAGYHTAYIGKYLNSLDTTSVPPGWNHWFVQQGNSKYYNFTMWRGGSNSSSRSYRVKSTRFSGSTRANYFTSVIQRETLKLLDRQAETPIAERKPLFAIISLPAPHGRADAEPQYQRAFPNVEAPRMESFNVRSPDKHWIIRYRRKLSESEIKIIDFTYRRRLQTLRSVDDLMVKVFRRLQRVRILNSSYVFFTSDHGFHLGQFAQLKGKNQPYEEDTRVPMFAFGPAIPRGKRVKQIVLNIDLAPTFLDIAKDTNGYKDMDGASIMSLLRKLKKKRLRPQSGGSPSLAWRTSFMLTKFKASQESYEDAMFFTGRWGKKNPVSREDLPSQPQLSGPPGQRSGRKYQQVLGPSGTTLRFRHNYQLPRQLANVTVTTNTTVTMRAAMVVKLVRWMKHSACRPIQRCTLQYLRAERLNTLAEASRPLRQLVRQRRSESDARAAPSSSLTTPGYDDSLIESLVSEQEACNCTPSALLAACASHPVRPGWKCNVYAPCHASGGAYVAAEGSEAARCQRARDCNKAGLGCQLITTRHWRTRPFYTGPDVCHCANTRNSSFWCERRIDGSHDYLFCRFVTGFEEYFDMRDDKFQLRNKVSGVRANPVVHKRLMSRLSYLRTCHGYQQCFSKELNMTTLDHTWSPSSVRPTAAPANATLFA